MKLYSPSIFFLFFAILILSCNSPSNGTESKSDISEPDPLRFSTQIKEFDSITIDAATDRLVFTGSSSIRGWKDLDTYYPDVQVINTGFGGSQMSDLLYHVEETILRFKPNKVFIYEGDNDISAGYDFKTIIGNTEKVVQSIETHYPKCKIILIAAKPSLARWHLKENYLELNRRFSQYANCKVNVNFANVWDIMLNENGTPIKSIFLEDGLHMNKSGYNLWDEVLRSFVEE